MEGFDTVRRQAHLRHKEVSEISGGLRTAISLLDAASEITGIEREAVSDDDPLLAGAEAVLDSSVPAIFYKNSVTPEQAAFYQAHEFGHYWLDHATDACVANDIDESMPEEHAPFGIHRVEGYGPRERRECQANVFAREFLLPCSEARRLFVDEQVSAAAIAERLGLPLGLVHHQLSQALLIPDPTVGMKSLGNEPAPGLDESQKAAAKAHDGKPHLIEAGPGTGKTRTLIARINWLLDCGVDPASILVLTFSNKAAEEIRERVAAAAPDSAPAIWAGTFHAFGLEILRKYGHLLDLPTDIQLLDPSEALLLLEDNLPSLQLDYYLQLYEPALLLQEVLKAISRAKEELIGPKEYRTFGESMLSFATNESEREAAEKVIEVAGIFAAYEDILKSRRVVDFTDLIAKAIVLLRDYPEVTSAIRNQYTHILVDEYQDVDRASGVLLKLLTGERGSLWVVGDARQSIYRFRGASPVNIREFETDFPGAKRLSLDINYRSQPPVVRLLEAFAPKMKAGIGGLPAVWDAQRGHQGGEILMEVATDLEAEAVGLAREINRRREQGVAYKDQAILCRTHTDLARFTMQLEAQEVPILYLGNLFERPEVRDLLALLSFIGEPKRGGLLRLATFPEYDVPLDDVNKVLAFSDTQEIPPPDAIRRLEEIPDLTPNGREGLERLETHLRDFGTDSSPTEFLFNYLFTRSRYLAPFLDSDGVSGQQRRLALFQFLQFVMERKPVAKGSPIRQLLRWIRRLVTFGDERQLRHLPSAASGIDAVRMLTVHASKGLEFRAVYLPGLGKGRFPLSFRGGRCPPPPDMLPEDPKDSHAEEEECLFFVAMSRARDVLCLSRAERYATSRSFSSPLLETLAADLPSSHEGPVNWCEAGFPETDGKEFDHLVLETDVHDAEDLDQYIKCPRAYLYQRILGLSGSREDSAYVRFHRAVYAVLRWLRGLGASETVTSDDALNRLHASWASIGPVDHPYEPVYWDAASSIVMRAIDRRSGVKEIVEAEWHIERPGGLIRLRPDHVEVSSQGVRVRRLRTGKPPKKIEDDIYALYQWGAEQEHGAAHVEALYLMTDEVVDVDLSPRQVENRLKKYDDAIAGICAGDFPARPNDRVCPRCPQYFICPAVPSAISTSPDI